MFAKEYASKVADTVKTISRKISCENSECVDK